MKLTALEKLRVNHINSVMSILHLHVSDIYETLCDKEFKETKLHIDSLQKQLKELSDSIQDEI
jgi:hypothetical protein